jgi:transcriptional regulator with XRE-family HTH domain
MALTESKDRLSLGDWILQHRQMRQLSQSRLAEMLGVNAGRIAEWELGLRVPTPQVVEKLAGVLAGGIPTNGADISGSDEPPPHVLLDDQGVAWVGDTNTKVVEIVIDHLEGKLSPLEIQAEYPELSLGEIHAALAYYFDHQAAFDTEMRIRSQRVEELRQAAGPSEAAARLRGLGLIV